MLLVNDCTKYIFVHRLVSLQDNKTQEFERCNNLRQNLSNTINTVNSIVLSRESILLIILVKKDHIMQQEHCIMNSSSRWNSDDRNEHQLCIYFCHNNWSWRCCVTVISIFTFHLWMGWSYYNYIYFF